MTIFDGHAFMRTSWVDCPNYLRFYTSVYSECAPSIVLCRSEYKIRQTSVAVTMDKYGRRIFNLVGSGRKATPSQRNGSYRPGKPLFDRRSNYALRVAFV